MPYHAHSNNNGQTALTPDPTLLVLQLMPKGLNQAWNCVVLGAVQISREFSARTENKSPAFSERLQPDCLGASAACT